MQTKYRPRLSIRLRYIFVKHIIKLTKRYIFKPLKKFYRINQAFLKNYERQEKIGMNYFAWSVTRNQVVRRDGYKCCKCHKGFKRSLLTVDHIIPLKDGGKSTFDNLQTLCRPCHIQKTRYENWKMVSPTPSGFPMIKEALEEAEILQK